VGLLPKHILIAIVILALMSHLGIAMLTRAGSSPAPVIFGISAMTWGKSVHRLPQGMVSAGRREVSICKGHLQIHRLLITEGKIFK
jgi:hypothetical protein